jgi:hypothetical protein
MARRYFRALVGSTTHNDIAMILSLKNTTRLVTSIAAIHSSTEVLMSI